jgi:hypothetical protein
MSRKQKALAKQKFDKYLYYANSVQSAEHDASLLWRILKKHWAGKPPLDPMLREDFCGTGELCFEWIKLGPKHHAIGVDIDPSALQWGRSHHASNLSNKQQARVELIEGDVLTHNASNPHIICALNFSYFFLKDRVTLKDYFTACRKDLTKNGLLILDVFGGPDYLIPHSDRRRNNELSFDYWWEVESFDALTNRIKTAIHFKPDGKPRRNKVFRYDWRLWSPPELADILTEVGFSSVEFWAEGLDAKGFGDGIYRKIHSEKDCETWVCYIIAK